MDSLRSTAISIDDAREMLSFIPAEDRDTWIKIGMALKAEFGDAGFLPFDEWSSTASNYDPKAARDTWKSFKGGGVTIASLIHLARENGWSPEGNTTKNQEPIKKPSTLAYAIELFFKSIRDDEYVAAHPYCQAKGIEWAGGAGRGTASGKLIGKNADCIIVPIRNFQTDKVQGVQCINSEGQKQTFGQVSGGGLILGNTLNLTDTWYVAEGWASAFSVVFHHGKNVCACSFGKSNLNKTAQELAEVYGPDEIIVL